MCNVCVSWENVDVSTISVADLLAYDALPHDVKVICAKKIAHEIDCDDDTIDLDDELEKARQKGREEADDDLEREVLRLRTELTSLEETRERELCEAEDKGYRRGLAEGKRITRSGEAAD